MRRKQMRWIATLISACMVFSCIPWKMEAVMAAPDPERQEDTAEVRYLYAEVHKNDRDEIEGFDYGRGMLVDPNDTETDIPEDYEAFGLLV